jgi:hypothetical protein
MHTASLTYCIEINVGKLIQKSKNKKIVRRTLEQLNAENLLRTKRSGFTHKRYKDTNISNPILITKNNIVIDGRHRLCKLFDLGRKTAKVVVMTEKEILDCIIGKSIILD